MNVVGIKFDDSNKIKYFDSNNINLKIGDSVIVDTDRGLLFGTVTILNSVNNSGDGIFNKVIRIANDNDIKKHNKNLSDAKIAIDKCNMLVKKYSLDMNIISASFTFNREQLMFKFMSDNRVDFRNLARDLGSIFKTRIELRQIGIRDKAKELGGIGPCGRKLCCNNFLNEFDSVSINMAKCQDLSLNPTKINGVCGRLLCCLKYENDMYKELKKNLPSVGETINNGDVCGKVLSVDILNQSYKLLTKDNDVILVELDNDCKK